MTPSKFTLYVLRLRRRLTSRSTLDLRSGARKSPTVPPPRQYIRKQPAMVVHTPTKLDVLRQTAAERRARDAEDVPPSVQAAAQDAAVDGAGAALPTQEGGVVAPAGTEDNINVLQEEDLVLPTGTGLTADDDERGAHVDAEVIVRAPDNDQGHPPPPPGGLGDPQDDVRAAGGVHPPPPAGLNPFTPEWFAQIIGAAAAAAGAAATAATTAASRAPSPGAAAAAPRRLNDRKVPDFWEDRPEFWFRIFDAHLSHFRPTERRCFDALLPLLTPAARSVVHSVIRTPAEAPYTRARDALLRHFGRTPRQLAREAREARSLGDKLPSEFLDHLMSLLPDIKMFYEVALLDALPANARIAALGHADVRSMALAADAVVLEARATAELDRPVAAVAAVSVPQEHDVEVAAVSRTNKPAQKSSLCSAHARWGKETYKCLAPSTCKMRSVIRPRPAPPASGNGKAGGQ